MVSDELHKKLTKLRHELHKHAELSLEETKTQKILKEFLNGIKASSVIEVGDTGLLATFDSEKKGPTILLRADTDALPIQEINDLEYKSETDGVSHKCGHDGHSAIMCGVAELLSERMPSEGKVHLLFQPAEEIGMGAHNVLNDKMFASIKPDFVFALHNIPGYPLGQIIVKEGAFTGSVKSLILRINGKTAHAAEPEQGINPAYIMAKILNDLPSIEVRDLNADDFAIITPTHGMFGEEWGYGTAAGYGELRLTLRSWSPLHMQNLTDNCLSIVDKYCKEFEADCDKEWTQVFKANINNKDALAMVEKAAKEFDYPLTYREVPFRWGEDFGHFTQHYRGCMFGIGAGEDQPALHNPDYNFPDDLIPLATSTFYGICLEVLG